MAFEIWAATCLPGTIALLHGGCPVDVLTTIFAGLKRRAIVLADRTFFETAGDNPALGDAANFELRLSRGLSRDLAEVAATPHGMAIVISAAALQAEIAINVARNEEQLRILTGYALPASLIEGLVIWRITELVSTAARNRIAPLIIHDAKGMLDARRLPNAVKLVMGPLANPEPSLVPPVAYPSRDAIRGHAAFLGNSGALDLAALHRPLRGAGLAPIIEHWRFNLTRWGQAPGCEPAMRAALAELDCLALDGPERTVAVFPAAIRSRPLALSTEPITEAVSGAFSEACHRSEMPQPPTFVPSEQPAVTNPRQAAWTRLQQRLARVTEVRVTAVTPSRRASSAARDGAAAVALHMPDLWLDDEQDHLSTKQVPQATAAVLALRGAAVARGHTAALAQARADAEAEARADNDVAFTELIALNRKQLAAAVMTAREQSTIQTRAELEAEFAVRSAAHAEELIQAYASVKQANTLLIAAHAAASFALEQAQSASRETLAQHQNEWHESLRLALADEEATFAIAIADQAAKGALDQAVAIELAVSKAEQTFVQKCIVNQAAADLAHTTAQTLAVSRALLEAHAASEIKHAAAHAEIKSLKSAFAKAQDEFRYTLAAQSKFMREQSEHDITAARLFVTNEFIAREQADALAAEQCQFQRDAAPDVVGGRLSALRTPSNYANDRRAMTPVVSPDAAPSILNCIVRTVGKRTGARLPEDVRTTIMKALNETWIQRGSLQIVLSIAPTGLVDYVKITRSSESVASDSLISSALERIVFDPSPSNENDGACFAGLLMFVS